MSDTTPGLHHVSAIAGTPRENVAFYTEVLGLRLVKRTVNFDEKFVPHRYYGDADGSPGSLLTFFPYRRGRTGRVGKPQPSATAFTIPPGAVDYWYDRLDSRGIAVEEPHERFGQPVVEFRDHDGLPVELVAHETDRPPVTDSIPPEYALRGLHSVTLLSSSVFRTAAALEVLGLSLIDQEGDRVRYRAPGSSAVTVDLLDVDHSYGREGIGTTHHVAFRAGDRLLSEWRERLLDAGLEPTWVKDRRYFESIYFRGPGGILFELATDGPGVTVDEDRSALGTALQLPPQYEPDREMIVQHLSERNESTSDGTSDPVLPDISPPIPPVSCVNSRSNCVSAGSSSGVR
jgi:glyoxalase family protein